MDEKHGGHDEDRDSYPPDYPKYSPTKLYAAMKRGCHFLHSFKGYKQVVAMYKYCVGRCLWG